MKKEGFFIESVYAVFSQGISLLTGIWVSFVLPKYIDLADYGYWQLFLLYSSYIGIFHFGFNDGIYLRLGGKSFDSEDTRRTLPELVLMSGLQICVAAVVALFAFSYHFEDDNKRIVLYFLSIYIAIENIYKILAFVLMATGRIMAYSTSVIMDKVLFLALSVIALFLLRADVWLILAVFVFSHMLTLIYLLAKFRPIAFREKPMTDTPLFRQLFVDIKCGIILTVSNLMASFIVGCSKFVIESHWDITTFAKLSFALTVSTFVMLFISQISYVLFPFLRRANEDVQKKVLSESTFYITLTSLFLFVLVFPLYWFIQFWLPNYSGSLYYLVLFVPMSFYEIKTNLIYNTYFKNLNKIRILLSINIMILIFAAIVYSVGVFMDNINVLVYGIIGAIVLRSCIMQLWLYQTYHLSANSISLAEFFLLLITLTLFPVFGLGTMWWAYLAFITFVVICYRYELKKMLFILKHKI